MGSLNRQKMALVAGTATAARLAEATAYPVQAGEIAFATDTAQLYVAASQDAGDFRQVPTLNPAEHLAMDLRFDADTQGVILIDRTTATAYRLYVDNGVLAIEAV